MLGSATRLGAGRLLDSVEIGQVFRLKSAINLRRFQLSFFTLNASGGAISGLDGEGAGVLLDSHGA